MEREAILEFFFWNGIQYSNCDNELFDSIDNNCIYEVVRLIKGIPLFIEDHLKRMRSSAEILGCSIKKSNNEIINEIINLSKANKCGDLNVKILCCDLNEETQKFLTYFIESKYLTQDVYENGVDTILYSLERKNPNAKTINTKRGSLSKAINAENAYEALLVNNEGYITEGSRSNVFFVKDNIVYTAPPEDVLIGITRSRIMELCKSENIEIVEKCIHEDMVSMMDGAFITGTSIHVLPVKKVGSKTFNSADNKIITRIFDAYLNIVNNYVKTNTK